MRDIYSFVNSIDQYDHVPVQKVLEGNIENPEITIFIPTYKRSSTLKVAIESALNQMGTVEYEIVVVNNDPSGISGETKEFLENYHSDRIYYYVNSENIGLCGNWNRGMKLARAEYVAIICDDDMLGPYFLESMMTAISENNRPGMVGVRYFSFNSKCLPVFQRPEKLQYRNVSKKDFFFCRSLNITGMTVRRDLFYEIGGYAEEYYPNEDTNLIYQAILKDRVIDVEYPLAGYRKEVNLSLTAGTMNAIILMMEETRRNIAEHEPFARRWIQYFDKELLYGYIRSANAYWDLNIDYKPIFKHFGFEERKPSWIKMKAMNFLQRLEIKRG